MVDFLNTEFVNTICYTIRSGCFFLQLIYNALTFEVSSFSPYRTSWMHIRN